MTEFIKYVRGRLLPPVVSDFLSDCKNQCALYLKLTGNDRKLVRQSNISLKDRHTGKRCFVLGGGSSINQQDLKKLQGEFVISVSNTFVHPEIPNIRPKYHVVPPIIGSHGGIYEEERFINWLREMDAGTFNAELVFDIWDKSLIEDNNLFKNRTIHWVEYAADSAYNQKPIDLSRIPPVWSVSETAITLAVHLGFDEIYLIGIDHDWFNGPMVYFYDKKTKHAMSPNESDIPFVDSEFQMRRHANIFKKYKYLQSLRKNIYNANANPNHYLDVFPKVEFESLFPMNVVDSKNEAPS